MMCKKKNIFAPSTRPSKDPLIWYRDLDFFCFLSLNILHRNIIKYRLCAITYTRNMWEGMLQLWKWVKLVVLYAKKSFLFFLKIMFFKAILLSYNKAWDNAITDISILRYSLILTIAKGLSNITPARLCPILKTNFVAQ